ncbi:MAG: methyl-accepting chemotaxis protein [Actinomycetota bacterium]
MGGSITDSQFELRHRLIVFFLAAHAPVLVLVALVQGFGPVHALVESAPVVAMALVARYWPANHFVRASVAALGLVVAASILVHFTGGLIEAHFHWFVVLSFVALYVDVRPFIAALIYTVLHHGVMSMWDPTLVFSTAEGQANPWLWTGIHVVFVVMLIAAIVANWLTLEQQEHERRLLLDRQRGLLDDRNSMVGEVQASSARLIDEAADVQSVMEEMVSSITAIDEGGQRVGELANRASARAERAEELGNETRTVVGRLAGQSEQIAELVAVVEEIASRTTLLALNANIEAARAGEAGRGFAVVANEVQALAGTTHDATEKIGAATASISDQLDASQRAIDDVVASVREIEELQSQVASELNEQIGASTSVRQKVEAASTSVDTMRADVDGLARQLDSVGATGGADL